MHPHHQQPSVPQLVRAAPAEHASSIEKQCQNYDLIAGTLEWLEANFERQPSLTEIAGTAGLSQAHFQRLFSSWVGISPKRYVQMLTLEAARRSLDDNNSVMNAALDSGLSGPGRLHDLFVQLNAISPGEYKLRGAGLEIRFGYVPTPFGECLLMSTERGVCGLAFTGGAKHREATFASLRSGFEQAAFVADARAVEQIGGRIFAPYALQSDSRPAGNAQINPLKVLVRGTKFQLSVWRALLSVPAGKMISYQELARRAGNPLAIRAAGSANAANAVCYLIPCHRVIRKNGLIGGYRWGGGRKLAMLSLESARANALGVAA